MYHRNRISICGNSIFQNFEIYNRNVLTGIERAYSTCYYSIEILALISCFCLLPVGRLVYLLHVIFYSVLLLGNTGCIISRMALPLVHLSYLLTGAILAMLFLGPAALSFKKKNR